MTSCPFFSLLSVCSLLELYTKRHVILVYLYKKSVLIKCIYDSIFFALELGREREKKKLVYNELVHNFYMSHGKYYH